MNECAYDHKLYFNYQSDAEDWHHFCSAECQAKFKAEYVDSDEKCGKIDDLGLFTYKCTLSPGHDGEHYDAPGKLWF